MKHTNPDLQAKTLDYLENPDIIPWERLPHETSKAYAAFCLYRGLDPGTRSIQQAFIAMYGTTTSRLRVWQGWSSNYAWVRRAQAWDAHRDFEARTAEIKSIKEMRARHIRESQALQAAALEALKQLDPSQLGASDILRFFIEAAKLERISVGEPDSHTDITSNGQPVHDSITIIVKD